MWITQKFAVSAKTEKFSTSADRAFKEKARSRQSYVSLISGKQASRHACGKSNGEILPAQEPDEGTAGKTQTINFIILMKQCIRRLPGYGKVTPELAVEKALGTIEATQFQRARATALDHLSPFSFSAAETLRSQPGRSTRYIGLLGQYYKN